MSNEAISTLLMVVTIIVLTLFFGLLIGRYIYKKIHHLPTGECACCHKSKKQLLKEYHKYCSQCDK